MGNWLLTEVEEADIRALIEAHIHDDPAEMYGAAATHLRKKFGTDETDRRRRAVAGEQGLA